ncbi:MAG: helix-turn-helix domain-containing protein [Vicinamibacteria bacterium]
MSAVSPGPTFKQQQVGEHVRRLREQARLSVRALAAQTDFSPSFISQLENAQVSPSIQSMERIANALGITLGAFFAAIGPGEGGLILKRSERERVPSSWSNAEIESLGRSTPRRRLDPLLIRLDPGGRSGKHPVTQRAEEFGMVLKGKVTLRLGPDEHNLKAGDSVTLLPGELRLWINTSKAPCEILLVGLQIA